MERTKNLLVKLGESNYNRIPEDIVKTLDQMFDESNSEVVDGSQKTIEKLRKDLQTSSTEKGNLEKLLSTSESSVADLRQQLNTANDQITLLTERMKSEKKQNEECRKNQETDKAEQELAASVKLLHTTLEDKKKVQDDFYALKQRNARLTQEIIETKSQVLKKENDIEDVENELLSKVKEILVSKKKEIQMRRVARKYMNAYFDLKMIVDNEAAKSSGEPVAGPSTGYIDTEPIRELSKRLTLLQEEIDELKEENENLRKQVENHVVTDARNRIVLNEMNRQILHDFFKIRMQNDLKSNVDTLQADLASEPLEEQAATSSQSDQIRTANVQPIPMDTSSIQSPPVTKSSLKRPRDAEGES